MLRRHSHPLLTSLLLLDALGAALAFVAAFLLRFHTGLFGPSQRPIPLDDYGMALPAVVPCGGGRPVAVAGDLAVGSCPVGEACGAQHGRRACMIGSTGISRAWQSATEPCPGSQQGAWP